MKNAALLYLKLYLSLILYWVFNTSPQFSVNPSSLEIVLRNTTHRLISIPCLFLEHISLINFPFFSRKRNHYYRDGHRTSDEFLSSFFIHTVRVVVMFRRYGPHVSLMLAFFLFILRLYEIISERRT